MLRASKRIVVISEQVNRYGFRVLIDGIDLRQYDKNPIMLWMHIRAFGDKKSAYLPLGNVIELKVEEIEGVGKCITGQPMFSEKYAFAGEIYDLYEEEVIRMASAGLIPVDWSDEAEYILAGQRGATLVKSILEEISIVDIGADNNALSVALYNDNHELIQLSLTGENAYIPQIKTPLIEIEMSKIELTAEKAALLLGMQKAPTLDEFEKQISSVVQLAQSQKTQIEKLTQEKEAAELKLANADTIQLAKDTDELLTLASSDEVRKITKDEVAYLKGNVKDRAGFDALKLYLDSKAGAPKISDTLKVNGDKTKIDLVGKTWDDLDQSGQLVQLKVQDMNAFKSLFKAKFNKEYAG